MYRRFFHFTLLIIIEMTRISISSPSLRLIFASIVILVIMSSLLAGASEATLVTSLSIDSDSITTDDGRIDGVMVDAFGNVTWDGADQQPRSTEVSLQVRDPDGNGWTTIEETSEDLSGLAGKYSFSFTDVDVTTDASGWSKSDFVSDTDGSKKETNLKFRLVVESQGDINTDSSKDRFKSDSATTTLTAVNEESRTKFGVSGGIKAEGTDQDPGDNKQEQAIPPNPSFELGSDRNADNWNEVDTADSGRTDSFSLNGNKSIGMRDLTGDYSGRILESDRIAVSSGRTYEFGAYYYLPSNESKFDDTAASDYRNKVEIVWIDGSGDVIRDTDTFVDASEFDSWNKITVTGDSPSEAVEAELRIGSKEDNKNDGNIYWDSAFVNS